MSEFTGSASWRTSSFSAGGDCVEWAIDESGVRVRHSLDREGPELSFTRAEWQAFLLGAAAGEADLPG